MTDKEIISIVYQILSKRFKIDIRNVKSNTKLKDLGLDSLSFVELILEIEELSGKNIDDKDTDKIKTINDLIKYTIGLNLSKSTVSNAYKNFIYRK